MKRIIVQSLIWDEESNETSIVTKFEDSSLLVEPISSEEASQWQAEHRF